MRAENVALERDAEGEPRPRLRDAVESAVPSLKPTTHVPSRPGLESDGPSRKHLYRRVRRHEPPLEG